MRFWTLYCDGSTNENTKALIQDDDTKSFSKYDISMNCLGYINFGEDYTLDDFTAANNLDFSIIDYTDSEDTLQSFFFQESQEALIGGDTNGSIFVLDTTTTDNGTDISCDLYTNAWNPYLQEGSEAQLNYLDIYVETEKLTNITVEFFKDTDIAPYTTKISDILPPIGYISSVVDITQDNPAQVTSPNHGLSTGDIVYIYGVQGMIEIDGQYTITYVDENNFTLDGIDSTAYTAYSSGGQLFENEYYRTKTWKRIIAGGIGFQHRIKISSTGTYSPLKILGFRPYFRKRGRRTIN